MLTRRQDQVARLVAQGKSNLMIGREIGIAEATVKEHVAAAAARVPGDTPPRHRLTVYVLQLEEARE